MDINQIIILYLVHSMLFGVGCGFLGAQKRMGALAGAALGALLGVIGLIIVLVSPRKDALALAEQLQKYKVLFDGGLISETEYTNLKGSLFEHQN
jgi:predicted transporter